MSVASQTCVGPGHPLYARAKRGRVVPVEEVTLHPFASPSQAFLGRVGLQQSLDGWRDDRFPRRIECVTSSLQLLARQVMSGRLLAYLPDYFVRRIGALPLEISGCPYSCQQRVKLIARAPETRGWMKALF